MENHDAGEGLCGIGRSGVEVGIVNGGHHVNRVVSNVLASAVILVSAIRDVSIAQYSFSDRGSTYLAGATSSTQCPKVPKVTLECRMSLLLVSITFMIGISWMTGAEMVVINSKIAAAKRRKVPTWWKIPVLAIVMF